MTNDSTTARTTALDRMEQAERGYKAAFFAAVLIEAIFLAGYVLLADFSNRTHLLLLIATLAMYTITAIGLLALGAHIKRNTLRILKAVELLAGNASK